MASTYHHIQPRDTIVAMTIIIPIKRAKYYLKIGDNEIKNNGDLDGNDGLLTVCVI